MIDSGHSDPDWDGPSSGDDDADFRLGRHAVGLLQAARETGDVVLIAQAEAMAMAVGYALASRLPDLDADNTE